MLFISSAKELKLYQARELLHSARTAFLEKTGADGVSFLYSATHQPGRRTHHTRMLCIGFTATIIPLADALNRRCSAAQAACRGR